MEDLTEKDTNESNRPIRPALKKAGFSNPFRKNLSVDLPALPEGRLFEPESSQGEESAAAKTNARTRHWRRFKRICTPPRWLRKVASWIYRKFGVVATYGVFFFLIYALLWILTGDQALPSRCYAYTRVPNANHTELSMDGVAVCYGGTTLAIVIYYAVAFACGQLVELVRIPGLLGMLLSGLLLRCLSVFTTSYTIFMDVPPPDDLYLPVVDTYLNGTTSSVVIHDFTVSLAATLRVNKELSATLRQIALATILTRAGLGLEPAVLRRIWSSMIRLTCLPCLTEALAGTVVAKYLMNWPWPWAAMMGFVLAAVSPAVVVPNMLRLEIAGWGVAQGIPTLIMAASSLDDVLAITGFGIAQAIAFAKGDIAMVAVSGPLEVLAGALLGVGLALVLWVLPPPAMEHSSTVRGMLLYAISISAITGTIKMGLPGAGALCCLICSLTCSVGWRNGMPWRFKRTNRHLDDMDTNKNNALVSREEQSPADALAPPAATEHHEYYHQHLRSLRRRLNKSGGISKRNALAAVSRSRRFSLPEPKPLYEEDDFNTIINDVDQSNAYLRRSLSAFRPAGAKRKGLVRWNTTTENTANVHTPTAASEDQDSDFLATEANSSAAQPLRVTPEALLALDKAKGLECLKVMRSSRATCWWFVQPLLFCLIGADIPVEKLRPDTIGLGIASIMVALTFRIFASVLAVTPSPLNLKEKIFVAVAWIPKASVQAAIGPLALDSARATGDSTLISWGEQIITLSALSILITAPTAAILIPLVAPCLLQQDPIFIPVSNSTTNDNNKNNDAKVDGSVSNDDEDIEASKKAN